MNDYRCLTILTIRANSSYPGCSYVSSLARWSGPEVRAVDKRISSLSSHSVAWSVSVCYTGLRTDYSQAPSLLSFLSALGPRSADSLAMAYDCLTPPLSSLLLLPPEPPFAPTRVSLLKAQHFLQRKSDFPYQNRRQTLYLTRPCLLQSMIET